MPELIKAGKLYKCVPPLYRISEKDAKKYNGGKEYVFDKAEYYRMFDKVVADHINWALVAPKTKKDLVKGTGDVTKLSRKERIQFMEDTVEYLPELETLSKRCACDVDVLENICYFHMMSRSAPNSEDAFEDLMAKRYPELHYDQKLQSIIGSVDGRYISLIVDEIFEKMSARLLRLMGAAPTYYMLVKNGDPSKDDPINDDWDVMTIGQFLKLADTSFHIDIEQRYKGLGESDASMIFPSLTNPKSRKLMRITMHDAEEALKTMTMLHGDTNENREQRRQMLREADITLRDIDN